MSNAHLIQKARPETADVLVIGAGASGSVAVRELVQQGFNVVCLEQGDWTPATEFTEINQSGN
jgi:glycerol-3-phosphate dehydrogenase